MKKLSNYKGVLIALMVLAILCNQTVSAQHQITYNNVLTFTPKGDGIISEWDVSMTLTISPNYPHSMTVNALSKFIKTIGLKYNGTTYAYSELPPDLLKGKASDNSSYDILKYSIYDGDKSFREGQGKPRYIGDAYKHWMALMSSGKASLKNIQFSQNPNSQYYDVFEVNAWLRTKGK